MRCAVILALLVVVPAGRATAQPADWAPQRSAFDPQVASRYQQILARDPFDDASLVKLARMVNDLDQRLAEDPAGLIVRARLHRKDRAAATGFYLRALERDPHGPFAARAWSALAELDRDRGDLPAARAAYAQVLTASPPAALARKALTELAAISESPDGYFAQLIAMTPADAELWLARGDALVAKEPVRAADSFAQAEKLIRDPQHRLDAIARRGHALAKAHDPAAAIAEYRRAIALAPKGYYLVAELVGRMVDVARENHTLPALAGALETTWPERTRGYLEWSTLAGIYLETRTTDEAIVAYERAARIAPWELATQRALIALLVKQNRDPRDQLRAAIRAAPSEPSLQLDLAKRTWPDRAALAMLDRTARQFARDGSVLHAVARQLADFGQPQRAEKWYEALARLEPDDEDHWLDLARAYIAADDHRGAIAAWRRVAREQPGAKLAFANLLLNEGDNHSARALIDESIALDAVNPEAWDLRAIADEQLYDLDTAVEDAEHAVRLTAPDRVALHRARHRVILIALKTRPDPDAWGDNNAGERWMNHLTRWHHAFAADKPDIDAGYYYLEATLDHECLTDISAPCGDVRATAEKLEKLVPDDPDVLRKLIGIYDYLGMHYAAAERYVRWIALASPGQRPALEEKLALERLQPDENRARLRLDDAMATPQVGNSADVSESAPRTWGVGLAIDYGATLRGSGGGSIGLGAYARYMLGPPDEGAANGVEARLDWSQGGDGNGDTGVALGIWHLFAPLHAASVSAGLDQRLAFSAGDARLASDASLVFALHEAPLELGLRMEQTYVGGLDTRGLLEVRVRVY